MSDKSQPRFLKFEGVHFNVYSERMVVLHDAALAHRMARAFTGSEVHTTERSYYSSTSHRKRRTKVHVLILPAGYWQRQEE